MRAMRSLIFLAVAGPVCANATEKTEYVGIWALEPHHCGEPQNSPNAPLQIAVDRYDQHTTHCAFTSVDVNGNEFAISANCTVEDNVEKQQFVLTVVADALTFTDKTGPRSYERCK